MKIKENWSENLKSQVCVYQIERAAQERKVKKKWFQQKDTKKTIYDFFLSVIKLIHYEIPTVEKKNTKKKSKLKLLKNVVREFCLWSLSWNNEKVRTFPSFCEVLVPPRFCCLFSCCPP